MYRFRNILVSVDRESSRQSVVARAARLAKQCGAAIKLTAVVENPPWYSRLVLPNADDLQALLVRDRSEALERIASDLRRDGLNATAEILRGRPYVETVREVSRGGHDLLMKEAEPNGRVLFGSVDMHLLRDCPCPVWLVKPGLGDRAFSRVLAAVDPAPPADESDVLNVKAELAPKDRTLDAQILELAGGLASDDGAELHVLHAWSVPGEDLVRREAMLAQEQVERYVEDSHQKARKAFEHLLATSPAPPDRRFAHLIKGDPADVIAEYAATHAVDLIVMGTVARSGIPGLLIGNTAETILQRVDCSVLAVKPQGFVSAVAAGAASSSEGAPVR